MTILIVGNFHIPKLERVNYFHMQSVRMTMLIVGNFRIPKLERVNYFHVQ